MVNLIDLLDKRILVTGASSGIGKETALLISRFGAKVIMVARREEKLEQNLSKLDGEGHSYYSYDLKDIDSIEALIKEIISENGKIDGFVHSAGIGSTRPLKMLKPRFIREVMEINFYSFVEIVRCISKKSNYNKGMSIIGISSVASLQGNQSKTAYCASKAAMDAAVRCMAKELAPKGIRVNTVMPALINTDIYKNFLEKGAEAEDARNVIARQYLGIGDPVDVANTVIFLLDKSSKFITGTSIAIDGGRLTS